MVLGLLFAIFVCVALLVALVRFVELAWPYLLALLALVVLVVVVMSVRGHDSGGTASPAPVAAAYSPPAPALAENAPPESDEERAARSVLNGLRARYGESSAVLAGWRAEHAIEVARLRPRLHALPAGLVRYEDLLRARGRLAETRRAVERVALLEHGIAQLDAATALVQEQIAGLEHALWMARHHGVLTRTLDAPEQVNAVAVQTERARQALNDTVSPIATSDVGIQAEAVFRRLRRAPREAPVEVQRETPPAEDEDCAAGDECP